MSDVQLPSLHVGERTPSRSLDELESGGFGGRADGEGISAGKAAGQVGAPPSSKSFDSVDAGSPPHFVHGGAHDATPTTASLTDGSPDELDEESGSGLESDGPLASEAGLGEGADPEFLLVLYDHDYGSRDDPLGTAAVPIAAEGYDYECYPVEGGEPGSRAYCPEATGTVRVSVSVDDQAPPAAGPTSGAWLKVSLTIHDAKGLLASDYSLRGKASSDPYVKVFYGGKLVGKTPFKKRTLCPRWDHTVRLVLKGNDADILRQYLARRPAHERKSTFFVPHGESKPSMTQLQFQRRAVMKTLVGSLKRDIVSSIDATSTADGNELKREIKQVDTMELFCGEAMKDELKGFACCLAFNAVTALLLYFMLRK